MPDAAKAHEGAASVEAVLAANTPRNLGVMPSEAEALLEELVAELPILLLQPGLTTEAIDFTLDAFAPLLAPVAAGNA